MSEAAAAPAFSIVLPLYNEEQGIRRVVKELLAEFEKRRLSGELVLVVNGSLDGTGGACRELAEAHPGLRVAEVPVNTGYGNGVLAGLREARGEWAGFMAGDGQVSPGDVCRVVEEALAARHDLVKAARERRADSLLRPVISWCYNRTIRLFFDVRSRDTHGMPKFVRRGELAKLQLCSRDWFLDDELMIKARSLGFSVREIPVTWGERVAGRSHVRPGAVLEFLKNLLAWRFGRMRRWRSERDSPRS